VGVMEGSSTHPLETLRKEGGSGIADTELGSCTVLQRTASTHSCKKGKGSEKQTQGGKEETGSTA